MNEEQRAIFFEECMGMLEQVANKACRKFYNLTPQDREDILQIAYETGFRVIERIDVAAIPDPDEQRLYLAKSVYNKINGELAKLVDNNIKCGNALSESDKYLAWLADTLDMIGPNGDLAADELIEILQTIMETETGTVKTGIQAILLMAAGHKTAEIAAMMNIKPKALRLILDRTRERLRGNSLLRRYYLAHTGADPGARARSA